MFNDVSNGFFATLLMNLTGGLMGYVFVLFVRLIWQCDVAQSSVTYMRRYNLYIICISKQFKSCLVIGLKTILISGQTLNHLLLQV